MVLKLEKLEVGYRIGKTVTFQLVLKPYAKFCSREESTEILISDIKAIKVISKTYQDLGGTRARGARALCLDRE